MENNLNETAQKIVALRFARSDGSIESECKALLDAVAVTADFTGARASEIMLFNLGVLIVDFLEKSIAEKTRLPNGLLEPIMTLGQIVNDMADAGKGVQDEIVWKKVGPICGEIAAILSEAKNKVGLPEGETDA